MQSESRLRPERLWLFLGVIWVVAFTLAPFSLSFSPNELSARAKEALEVDEFDWLKDVAHIASFFVIGILVAANLDRPRASWTGPAIVLLIGCIALESMQLLQPGRHARLTDLILNVAGAIGGLTFAFASGVGERLCEKVITSAMSCRIAPLIVLTGVVCLWWFVGLRPSFGGLSMDWDRTFPLAIGNEIGGARQWAGQLRYAGIYGGALSRRQVRDLYGILEQANSSQWRENHQLLVGYDFRRDPVARLKPRGQLSDETLELDIPPNLDWSSVDGITISRSVILRTGGSAVRLTDKIRSLEAFTVEAWVRPANLVQAGPARLVSISSSPAFRNFTLGQLDTFLVFRVRNRVNGLNGINHELWVPSVVATTWQHYIGAYDHGVSTVYLDGAARRTLDLREPTVYFGLAPFGFGRAAVVILAVITLSLPATFVFEALFKFRTACIAAAAFTFVAGILPYVINSCELDDPQLLNFIAPFLTGLLLLYPLSLLCVSSFPTFAPKRS